MTPSEVTGRLNRIVAHKLKLAVMLWGAPGIGKSSVVQQVAQAHDLELIDLRLSQLAPTDLRGLPVPENGLAKWFPPEFLPREGKGILFLDELNLAPPAIQGIAQSSCSIVRLARTLFPPIGSSGQPAIAARTPRPWLRCPRRSPTASRISR